MRVREVSTWSDFQAWSDELPRIDIHESEMPANADELVPCSQGESGCPGREELSLMSGNPEDGYVCEWCSRVGDAMHEEYVRDIRNFR
jgi:hypothetical protein